tara:strand:+ start:123 stop:419 length:297 start_codon:yes stop_codon:yes gene_type:complete
MNDRILTHADIPAAPFYVTCTDKFMSGWGPTGGRNNRLVFVCATQAEAWTVYDNACGRTDQKNVHVCTAKPRLCHYTNFYQVKTSETCGVWYEPGTWK